MAKNVSNRKNMSAQNRPFSLKATKKTQKVNLQTTIMDSKKVAMYALALGTLVGVKLYGDKCYVKGLLKGATLNASKEDSEKEKVEKEEA